MSRGYVPPAEDGWGTPARGDGSAARGIGVAVMAWSFGALVFLLTFAWGGFAYSLLAWRIIGCGAVATVFVGGLALVLGGGRLFRRRPPSR